MEQLTMFQFMEGDAIPNRGIAPSGSTYCKCPCGCLVGLIKEGAFIYKIDVCRKCGRTIDWSEVE